ncbi:hypothetical protein BJY00DRAFT_311063 [Aspergillus carlsbadensis]|nr:hypothetical protein BJY00DRAFT_311063 [Aspergillus carlsbadensis]
MAVGGLPVSATADQPLYVRLLEERLRDLEQRLLAVEATAAPTVAAGGQGENGTSDSRQGTEGTNGESDLHALQFPEPAFRGIAPLPPDLVPPIVPKVRRMGFIPYVNRALPAKDCPAVEVLHSQLPFDRDKENNDKFVASLVNVSPEKALEMIRSLGVERSQLDPAVVAVRINSRPLSELLLSLLCDYHGKLPEAFEMVRPFKHEIFYHGDVRRELAELEANQRTDAERRLVEDLRCYTEVMDRIVAFYSKFDTLAAADDFKVHWEDLWHLFKPGETIVYPAATATPCAVDYANLHKGSRRAEQTLWRVYTRRTRRNPDGTHSFWVKAYCIGYDGEAFLCQKEWFQIPRYEWLTSVTSLRVFPIRFSSNAEGLMAHVVQEGRKFRDFLETRVVAHDGWASEPDGDAATLRHVTGDVIIDFAETFKANPGWEPVYRPPANPQLGSRGSLERSRVDSVCHWIENGKLQKEETPQSFWAESQVGRLEKREFCCYRDRFLSTFWDPDKVRYALHDEDYHLLPSRLFGYSLQDRKFVSVSVSNLRPIENSSRRFQDLIIDESHEKMLRALVRSHFARKELRELSGVHITNQDIIQNKGKGLIILLHGVPGVGKTSTAEAMAMEFKKPLLPMTCGDLGLEPEAVENSLKELFRLAQTWDCILLLDEADVFLTERIPSDLRRNALVSVFLRVLDYYSGVLFLTTNRVGTIDEAFKSRIHASLYYRPLTKGQSERIWAMNLRRLVEIEQEKFQATNEPPLVIDQDGILQFAREEFQKGKDGTEGRSRWNGRQIRNAVLIASALARYDKADTDTSGGGPQADRRYDLRVDHFRTVVRSGLAFERYLYKVKRMTDGEKAFVDGVRADHANVTVRSPSSATESAQGLARPQGIGLPPQMVQQWPHAQANAHAQPYNVPHGDSGMHSPVYLSPTSHIGSMQHPQQQQQPYSVDSGYPGQMGHTQLASYPASPLGGYPQGHSERQRDYDSSD